MIWSSFVMGGMTVIIAYAIYDAGSEDEELVLETDQDDNDVIINGPTGRYVTLSCQTCRKLKKHKEVEPNLYQCTRCKRHVDLRAS